MLRLLLILAGCCCTGIMAAVDLSACLPNPPKIISTIWSPKGSIYSPGYNEGTYPNDITCAYTITAPFGYKIKLTFKDFDIDPHDLCMKDMLAIHEGDNPRTPVHGIFCGNSTPNALVSGANKLHMVFRSDFLKGGKGFHIEYEAAMGHTLCPFGKAPCRNRNCYTISQKCNGVDECGDGTDEENCGHPSNTMECGVPDISPMMSSYEGRDRVIGGKEVVPGSIPWQADLHLSYYWPNGHMCGGTLVNEQWVVSAAHCFQGNPRPEEWRIHLGNHNKFVTDAHEQVRYVERIIVYPGFTGNQLAGQLDMVNDVSLIKLNAPVKFTKYVRPACFPQQGEEVAAGTKCLASGWGMTRGSGSSHVLKQVDLTIRKYQECQNNMMPFNNKTMICVANDKGFQDVCHGDSGGPLVCKYGIAWRVMGATSFGTATNYESGLCALPEARTVYSKLSDKTAWVKKTMSMYS